LTNQEIEDLKKSEDSLYWKIVHYSEHLQAPAIDAEAARFNQLKLKKKAKVVSLNYKNVFKIAAAIASLYFILFFIL
jgi:hypothetical protein